MWPYYPEGLLRHPEPESGLGSDNLQEEPVPLAHPSGMTKIESEENRETEMRLSMRDTRFSRNCFSFARSRMSAMFRELAASMSKPSWTAIPASHLQKFIPQKMR